MVLFNFLFTLFLRLFSLSCCFLLRFFFSSSRSLTCHSSRTLGWENLIILFKSYNYTYRCFIRVSDLQEWMIVFHFFFTFLTIVKVSTNWTFISNSREISLFTSITNNSIMSHLTLRYFWLWLLLLLGLFKLFILLEYLGTLLKEIFYILLNSFSPIFFLIFFFLFSLFQLLLHFILDEFF